MLDKPVGRPKQAVSRSFGVSVKRKHARQARRASEASTTPPIPAPAIVARIGSLHPTRPRANRGSASAAPVNDESATLIEDLVAETPRTWSPKPQELETRPPIWTTSDTLTKNSGRRNPLILVSGQGCSGKFPSMPCSGQSLCGRICAGQGCSGKFPSMPLFSRLCPLSAPRTRSTRQAIVSNPGQTPSAPRTGRCLLADVLT